MRGTDLNLKELLQVDPAGGILRFENERVLLFSGPVDFGIGAAIGTTTGTQTPPTSSPEWTNFIPAVRPISVWS